MTIDDNDGNEDNTGVADGLVSPVTRESFYEQTDSDRRTQYRNQRVEIY